MRPWQWKILVSIAAATFWLVTADLILSVENHRLALALGAPAVRQDGDQGTAASFSIDVVQASLAAPAEENASPPRLASSAPPGSGAAAQPAAGP